MEVSRERNTFLTWVLVALPLGCPACTAQHQSERSSFSAHISGWHLSSERMKIGIH